MVLSLSNCIFVKIPVYAILLMKKTYTDIDFNNHFCIPQFKGLIIYPGHHILSYSKMLLQSISGLAFNKRSIAYTYIRKILFESDLNSFRFPLSTETYLYCQTPTKVFSQKTRRWLCFHRVAMTMTIRITITTSPKKVTCRQPRKLKFGMLPYSNQTRWNIKLGLAESFGANNMRDFAFF